MNKEFNNKIFDCLNKIETISPSQQLNNKKIISLLTKKKKYEELSLLQSEYQELILQANQTEKNLLQTEIAKLETQKEQLITQIKAELIQEEATGQNIVMEIRPGTGGDEAGLFVRDLYRMYSSFADKKGWGIEIIENKVGLVGNFDFVSFLIKGKSAYNYLKNEAGVHRVQRIPKTEKKDKPHTSTASVVVLPEPQDIVLNIRPQDLKIETCRSSGAGGQHVNTTDSAVKITYTYSTNGKTETITATSQDGRSQHDNRRNALTVLKSRLWEKLQTEKEQKVGNLRSTMIGTAERSENFRTYNFLKDRVVDKRLEIKLLDKVSSVMEGDLEEICQRSIDYQVEKSLVRLISQLDQNTG